MDKESHDSGLADRRVLHIKLSFNDELEEEPKQQNTVERRFWAHIMATGLRECICDNKAVRRRARKWLLSDDYPGIPGSIRWLCNQLDLDLTRVRRYVRDSTRADYLSLKKQGFNRTAA